jgi:hypothetical protein
MGSLGQPAHAAAGTQTVRSRSSRSQFTFSSRPPFRRSKYRISPAQTMVRDTGIDPGSSTPWRGPGSRRRSAPIARHRRSGSPRSCGNCACSHPGRPARRAERHWPAKFSGSRSIPAVDAKITIWSPTNGRLPGLHYSVDIFPPIGSCLMWRPQRSHSPLEVDPLEVDATHQSRDPVLYAVDTLSPATAGEQPTAM